MLTNDSGFVLDFRFFLSPTVVGLSLDEGGRPEFMKAKVLDRVDGKSVSEFSEEAIEPGAAISSDGLAVYNSLAEKGFDHRPMKYDPIGNPDHLMWLHVVISNLKAFLNGTYHGVSGKHLQAYIDEFAYRFNRRFWPGQLFARTLTACAYASPFTRHALIG